MSEKVILPPPTPRLWQAAAEMEAADRWMVENAGKFGQPKVVQPSNVTAVAIWACRVVADVREVMSDDAGDFKYFTLAGHRLLLELSDKWANRDPVAEWSTQKHGFGPLAGMTCVQAQNLDRIIEAGDALRAEVLRLRTALGRSS